MKIRLEPQKTYIRLSKPEYQELLKTGFLAGETIFSQGAKLKFCLELKDQQNLHFSDHTLHFALPNQQIQQHTPKKTGLSFYFQIDSNLNHELIFEVDIRKPRLSSRKKNEP